MCECKPAWTCQCKPERKQLKKVNYSILSLDFGSRSIMAFDEEGKEVVVVFPGNWDSSSLENKREWLLEKLNKHG